MASLKRCRKCGATNLEPFFGTNGAPFLKCQTCGHKARTGLDADTIRNIVRDELRVSGGRVSAAPAPAPAPQPAPEPKALIDEKTVRAAVDSHVKQLETAIRAKTEAYQKAQVIEVKQVKGPSVRVEGAHYLLPRLIRLVRAGFHVYLWGDAGTGKTTAAFHAAKALKFSAEIDTMDPTTFRSMVQGYMTPEGKPVHTTFTRCWSTGKLYVADEIDNAPGHVQTLFNSALANGHAPLAWGNVEQHKSFAFIGTGNTPGRPTRAFPDRKPMSAAFADRLYFVHWPLDPAIEARAAGLEFEAPAPRTAESVSAEGWTRFVQGMRDWARANCPTLMVTPRATLLGLEALRIGEHPSDVADALIFRGADDDIRSKALNSVRWV